MYVCTQNVKLFVDVYGELNSPRTEPLILLHGMTLSGRDWRMVTDALVGDWTPITIDIVGHGRSEAPRSRERYKLDAVLDQLSGVVKKLGLDSPSWVGYSMGGRILLHLAVREPQLVQRMILESTTPGIESEPARLKRRRKDERLADYLEEEGVEAFVDRWLSAPIFDSQDSVSEPRRERARKIRLNNDPRGMAHCLRELSRGRLVSVWDQLAALTIPVKLITGEFDEKHHEIHKRMHQKLPRSSSSVVPNVGHNVHFEDPEAFVEEISLP